ncbi:MAG TPA: response regulator, partial [Reyranella sp.]|nr:response regulator [Reyranella sp.]
DPDEALRSRSIGLDLAGVRAFIVEDEALVLMTLEDMLADLGCTVVASARHVEEALGIAPKTVVDIALLDVNVGGVRIDPVARLLAERGIPIVFVTGYEAPSLPRIAHAVRVAKPFHADELAHGMRQALAGRRA